MAENSSSCESVETIHVNILKFLDATLSYYSCISGRRKNVARIMVNKAYKIRVKSELVFLNTVNKSCLFDVLGPICLMIEKGHKLITFFRTIVLTLLV